MAWLVDFEAGSLERFSKRVGMIKREQRNIIVFECECPFGESINGDGEVGAFVGAADGAIRIRIGGVAEVVGYAGRRRLVEVARARPRAVRQRNRPRLVAERAGDVGVEARRIDVHGAGGDGLPALADDGRGDVPGIPQDAVGLVDADGAGLRQVASRPGDRIGRILRREDGLDRQDGHGETA